MSLAAAASLLRRSGGAVSRYYHGFRRSFATQTLEIGNQRRGRQQKQQLPWMLLSSRDNPKSRYLYKLTGDGREPFAFDREIHLPEIAGHHLIGSSQGYLLSVDDTAEIHATDPLTGARLPVPSTAGIPSIAGVLRDPAGNRTHYVINCDDEQPLDNIVPQISVFEHSRRVDGGGVEISVLASLDPEQVDILDLEHMKKKYYGRAILSPSLNTAVVIIDKDADSRPAFVQIGPSSSSWTALYSPSYDFKDLIFHQGRLHAVNISGTLVVFDLDDPLGQPPLVSPRGPVDEDRIEMSLMESPDGDDLFLVLRKCSDTFSVFKLDKSIYEWNPVDSIGDVAIFLGPNDSIAISAEGIVRPNSIYSIAFSAADFSAGGIVRPNSIYFTDDRDWVCLYNLGDDSHEVISHVIDHKFNSQQWFMPTPS